MPTLRLGDGTLVALAGVAVPAEQADQVTELIGVWLGGGAFTVRTVDSALDRHRRRRVALVRDGRTLQASLVEAGLAMVAPELGIGSELLPLETAARARRRGSWATGANGPFDARDVPMTESRYALVEGRIARTGRPPQFWYANFGDDSPPRLHRPRPARRREGLHRGGRTTWRAWRRVGRAGWLFEDNGPMIEITTYRSRWRPLR